MSIDGSPSPLEPHDPLPLEGTPSSTAPGLFVVGIGASAGGLEALERFFDNVPRDGGVAYVVVQHLSPDFRSLMDELLARHTELPITLVEDGMTVAPDHVYLIPPKKEMIISGGRLLLSERERQHELSLPIDVFFRSLAQDCGRRSVAVVLSGGGSDGSRGIRAVHDAGGLVLVQDTASAQFDGMPRTARDAGVADWVLSPGEMPRVIADRVRRGALGPGPDLAAEPAHGLGTVYEMLQKEFGIDFTHYKPSTVTRRIERRIRLARAESLDDYVSQLKNGRDELDVLYRDLLIGVTRFFRNEDAFAVLADQVLPEILAGLPRGAPFRAWVAGCATGEEVYSLAILLDELSTRLGPRTVQIFATDVHKGSLERASRGVYDDAAVANVSAERLERYFWHRARGFEVVPELRRMVVFAQHNVIRDPPFTRVDLVSCRNLLIYLQPAAQQKALGLFHFALNRGGVVFLGPSESPGPLLNDYEPVNRHWRMYRKTSNARIDVDARLQPHFGGPSSRVAVPAPVGTAARYSIAQLLATYDTLLAKHMPPGLLVSDRGELVHAFSGASRFLRMQDGRQALDVLDFVHPELRTVLLGALQRAAKDPAPLMLKGVHAAADDETLYNIRIERVGDPSKTTPSFLVMFESTDAHCARPALATHEVTLGDMSRERVAELERELSYTKENLQAAIEELQASNEELQASNEELLASNEELQSTNEELQSVNEELYTVNAEYQRKIAELTELTNDMDNLLAATDVGTLFLDKQMRIRRFTAPIASKFNFLAQDVGRSIETFRHNLGHAGLVDDIRRVVDTGERVEREVKEPGGATSFLRVLPYRVKGAVEGAVVTRIDVTGLKAAEDALFHERHLLNSLLTSISDAIYFKDARGRFIRANDAMARRLGLGDPAEAVGKTPLELPNQGAALELHREDQQVLDSGEPHAYRLEQRTWPDGTLEWDLVTRLPIRDPSGGAVGVIGVFRDVTEQKRVEETIKEGVRRRDEFLAMLSHELRNPLGAMVTATSLLHATDEAQRSRLIGVLDRQTKQMARLLDDLLEVTRVTENKIELRKTVIDLRDVARDAVESIRASMEARHVELKVDFDEAPVWVDGDAVRLQQVQANLLGNAAKYTPAEGHVRLVVQREARDAVVRVQDDGAGIAPRMLDKVFDMFVQADRTLDRAEGGLGVGLTLVRSLVAMHGGTAVALSSGEGQGAEFVVRLPLTDAPAASPPDRPRHDGARRVPVSRVAVIEDNADSREMLCEVLSTAGFQCDSADNGIAGLALIEATRPDVALVDMGLPGLNGLELAQRVRASGRFPKLLLVALTGYGQQEDRRQAAQAGYHAHFVKPVDPHHLVGFLRDGVRESSSEN